MESAQVRYRARYMESSLWQHHENVKSNIFFLFPFPPTFARAHLHQQEFYICEITYTSTTALTRVSILLFYLTLFNGKGFRMAVYCVIGISVVSFIVIDIAAVFQCTPISYAWTNWDGEHSGTCIPIHKLAWVGAASAITLDIITICLPFFPLYHLPLSRKLKLQVGAMFLVGCL